MANLGEQWWCNLFLSGNHINENIGGWLRIENCHNPFKETMWIVLPFEMQERKAKANFRRRLVVFEAFLFPQHEHGCSSSTTLLQSVWASQRRTPQLKQTALIVHSEVLRKNHKHQDIFMLRVLIISKDWSCVCYFLKSILLFTNEGEIRQRFTEKMSIYQERNSKISFGHNLEIKSSIKRRCSSVHLFHRRALAWLSTPWYPQQATDPSDKRLYETVAGSNFWI